jgi:anionic cell wall polymer biosynthesis LytR-Cps2A-Psr (LCP) family protein
MNLLFFDREEKRGAVVYIPAHSAVEVPGRGLQAVGDSLSSGGVPLLLLSTETLLGIPVDHYVELSNTDARLLFDQTGPVTVDVPEEVRVEAGPNQARVIFDKGLQRLPSSLLAQLLYTVGLDDNDVGLGNRHLAFWASLFTQFEENPAALGQAVDAAGSALEESDLSSEDLAAVFDQIASLDQQDRTVTTLPVTPVSVGGSELFQSDSDEIETFMSDTLGVDLAGTDDVRVQILNGNGEPGIGQEVAEKLVPGGFRVVLTGNAPRLDYRKTLVITYDSSSEGTALAERAQELLGVGKVQVSAQPQGIVDLTIVVGKDFLRKR